MKTLTIKQPWASLICTPRKDNPTLGIKDIENRTWRTKYRGKLLIHASAKKVGFDNWYDSPLNNNQLLVLPDGWAECSFVYGAIIGEVTLVDCVINNHSVWAQKSYETANLNSLPFHEEDEKPIYIYNWVLANPILYDEPILNVKGKLSFWEFKK